MTQTILISGKKRSGKDYFAKELAKTLNDMGKTTEIVAFADPMKFILSTTLDLTLEEFDQLKSSESGLYYCSDDLFGENDTYEHITNFRSMIQKFGTEAMQTVFSKKVWSNIVLEKLRSSEADYMLVTDFRFLHEKIGDITVNVINRDVKNTDQHNSENELKDFDFLFEVDNTGKPDLTPQVYGFIVNALGL